MNIIIKIHEHRYYHYKKLYIFQHIYFEGSLKSLDNKSEIGKYVEVFLIRTYFSVLALKRKTTNWDLSLKFILHQSLWAKPISVKIFSIFLSNCDLSLRFPFIMDIWVLIHLICWENWESGIGIKRIQEIARLLRSLFEQNLGMI